MRHTVVENSFGHLQYKVVDGRYFIHLELKAWSKTLYKDYLTFFFSWLKELKEKTDYVYALIPANDDKLYKFEQMFGFIEASRTDEQVVMYLDIRGL